MNKQFKPDRYNSVSPYIMVDDAQRLIDMLVQIFDAKEKKDTTNQMEKLCMQKFKLMIQLL
ncbi:MAG: hypothetical protein ABI638_08475 [Ignavibacteriota bacterium]